MINSEDVVDLWGSRVFRRGGKRGKLEFVDTGEGGWPHPCRYVFWVEGEPYMSVSHSWPPADHVPYFTR